jgi:hypothetical protein
VYLFHNCKKLPPLYHHANSEGQTNHKIKAFTPAPPPCLPALLEIDGDDGFDYEDNGDDEEEEDDDDDDEDDGDDDNDDGDEDGCFDFDMLMIIVKNMKIMMMMMMIRSS